MQKREHNVGAVSDLIEGQMKEVSGAGSISFRRAIFHQTEPKRQHFGPRSWVSTPTLSPTFSIRRNATL